MVANSIRCRRNPRVIAIAHLRQITFHRRKARGQASRSIAPTEGHCSVRLSSAHVMGGCRALGSDPQNSVTRPDGRHQQLQNCWIFDGIKIFYQPVSAQNPQLSIYAFVAKISHRIVTKIGLKHGADFTQFAREPYLKTVSEARED